MAFINIQGIVDYFNSLFSFVASDKLPVEVADKVIPVIDINPLSNPISNILQGYTFNLNIVGAGTQTETIYTTPTNLSLLLTQVFISGGTFAGANAQNIELTAVVNGTTEIFISASIVGSGQIIPFSIYPPLIIDKNTPIIFSCTTSGGGAHTNTFKISLYGFTMNNNPTGQQLIQY